MGMFEEVLGWLDQRKRAAKLNTSDLMNNPRQYLGMLDDRAKNYNQNVQPVAQGDSLYNRPMTEEEIQQKHIDLAMNFAGGGVGSIKGVKLSAQPTRDELAKIADRLAIHQDLRPGSADRVSSIMEQGLSHGMVDPFEPYLTGKGWTWGRGKIGAEDVYLFDTRNLKYRGKGNPYLKEGNMPIAHFTKQELSDILSGQAKQRPPIDLRDTTYEPPLFPDTTR